jgi:hypothetical protein
MAGCSGEGTSRLRSKWAHEILDGEIREWAGEAIIAEAERGGALISSRTCTGRPRNMFCRNQSGELKLSFPDNRDCD